MFIGCIRFKVKGDIYFVDATNGSDGNLGLSADQAFKTLAVAYAAAGSGDTIALSTNSSHSLTAGIAWTKSRINRRFKLSR